MKYVLLFLLVSTNIFASPILSSTLSKQKDKQLLQRVVEQELHMNADKMKHILASKNIVFTQEGNQIKFEVQGYSFIIIYDTKADRMRIVCPIAKMSDISDEQIKQAMDANFHTALDARYATTNGVMWSVFIHPLSDLSEQLFRSALDQTLIAAATFGKEYVSGALSFPKAKQPLNNSEINEK